MGEDGKGSRELQRYLCDGSCFSPPPPKRHTRGGREQGRGSTKRAMVGTSETNGDFGKALTVDTFGTTGRK